MIQVLVQALCWTLIHSLWQGLLAAVLAGGVVMVTKRYSARLRYNLLALIFFGFVAVSGGTFLRELGRGETQGGAGLSLTLPGQTAPENGMDARNTGPARAQTRSTGATMVTAAGIGAFCNTHALLIVSLWLLILLIKLGSIGIDLGYVHHIRRYKTTLPPAHWTDRVRELAAGIGLTNAISLMESALIDVPMVIGFLKPVILLPLGILSQLPQDQLEAVLLHELAHIRRKDYLVNLLQSLVETLFFFNPAILWISGLIREERENCCDDVAIGKTRSKAQLIHALVAFQEFRAEGLPYAVAFPGRRNQLLDRVKRIIYNRNKSLNAMEKLLLASCLLVAGAVTLALSPAYRPGTGARRYQSGQVARSLTARDTSLSDTIPPPARPAAPTPVSPVGPAAPVPPAPVPAAPVPPAPANAGTLAAPLAPVAPLSSNAPFTPIQDGELKGGSFEGSLRTENGVITYANGVWTNGDIVRYFGGGFDIEKKNGAIVRLRINGQQIPESQFSQYQEAVNGIIGELKEERDNRVAMAKERKEDMTQRAQELREQQAERAQELREQQQEQAKEQEEQKREREQELRERAQELRQQQAERAQELREQQEERKQQIREQQEEREHDSSSIKKTTDPIVSEIISERLASDKKALSFTLNWKDFIINGVVQPKEITDRYRQKYVEGKKDSYVYVRKDNSISSSVTIDH